MKILLAPSEAKKSGGEYPFNPQSLLFENLASTRMQVLHAYTNVIQQDNPATLSKMFGLKKEADIQRYKQDIIHELSMKAIERYIGVAFEYLDYTNLNQSEQSYIDSHVILFSNLFGAIRAFDLIPDYKLKQGEAVGDIKTERLYHEHAFLLLEDYFKDEEILDLRAGFYTKFYKPKKDYTTLKFIKNGKVISHWAKAYRGIVLRHITQSNINSIDELIKLEMKNLCIKEINIKKNHREIVYDILIDEEN
jgi:cytoplasmic iron level regulating protein YaaA (DUF328/UPF0246 family)